MRKKKDIIFLRRTKINEVVETSSKVKLRREHGVIRIFNEDNASTRMHIYIERAADTQIARV